MSGPMSCETCARLEFLVAAGCWCPVLGRMLEEGEMDDYPPCGGVGYESEGADDVQ